MEKVKKNKICVDYHFHANLPVSDKKAKKHIIEYWKHIVESGVNVVLSTEHVYKNPKRAYEFMKKYQPDDCLVFPGMEYITKEGIDLVIFSENERIYDYEELKPMSMDIDEVVDFVKSKNLYATITHPYLMFSIGIVYNVGYKKFQEILERIKAIEVVSGSFWKLKIFKFYSKFKKSEKSHNMKVATFKGDLYISRSDYNPEKIDFITVGSDAHQFCEVGNCLELSFNQDFNKKNVFQRIINSKDGKIKVVPRQHSLYSLLRAIQIIFEEILMKQKNKN